MPTALKVLRGNPGHRPLNEHEPVPPAGEIEAPAWLYELDVAALVGVSVKRLRDRARETGMRGYSRLSRDFLIEALLPYTPRARAWARLEPVLSKMGVLSTADVDELALIVDALADYIEARAIVQREGLIYESTGVNGRQVKAHPAERLAADAWRRVHVGLKEFGMTPSSRSKVEADPADSRDEVDRFMDQIEGAS